MTIINYQLSIINFQTVKDKKKNKYHRLHLLIALGLIIFLSACATISSEPQSGERTINEPVTIAEGVQPQENIAALPQPTEKTLPEEPITETAKVSEFIIGAGDRVEILVYRHDDLRRTVQIDISGKIIYPLLGDIQAAGLSIFQLRDKIRDGLSKYIVDPQVSVGIIAVQNQKVIVLGEVKNPGFFQIETFLTAFDAISKAGGFTLDGKQNSVLLIRGGVKKPELITLNLEKALKEGDLTQNIMLQRGDVIYVPRTFISNVDRFFTHLSTIISPLLSLESGYYIGQQIERSNTGASIPAR